MYTNFASGNLSYLEPRLCEGILGSLKQRVSQRSPNTALKWTLHKHLSKPRLASYKAALMPKQKDQLSGESNGVVQAVVRLHTLQSLQHLKRITLRDDMGKIVEREVVVDVHGREVPPVEDGAVPKDAKEAVEYFVIQKSLRKGKEGPWKVWGTAEEMTMERINREDKKRQQMSLGKGGGD